MPKIIMDHRESSSIKKELIKEGVEVEIKQLNIADFIVQTKNLDNKVQTVGIERKTVNDLLNSIIDKRLLNQLVALKDNFEVPILIIEGRDNIYAMRDFHPNSIRGIISTVALDFQIPIINTMNYKDTAKYLSLIANRLEKSRKPLSLLQKRKALTTEDQQLAVVGSLPGVGSNISKSLLENFGSINNIVNASEKELSAVDKIGKIKAKKLKELFVEKFKS